MAASAFDDDHTIAIYDWQQQLKPGQTIKPIASGKGTRANILSLGFNPIGDTLVATAIKEVNFYTFEGGILKATKGIGWGTNPQEAVLCQAFVDNTLYTGTFSGSILSWSGRSISKSFKAHTDGCHAMYPTQKTKGIISGGGDGQVIIWNAANGGL